MELPAPVPFDLTAADGVPLRLTRHRGGSKGPVLLMHGLGVHGGMFSLPTVREAFVPFLLRHGYDVFVLDWRASTRLPLRQFSLDEAAVNDVPAAVAKMLEVTSASSVQAVVHCAGAGTFFMALAAGLLPEVRCVSCSQVALHYLAPAATAVKSFLHLPEALDSFGVHALSPEQDADHPVFQRLWGAFVDAVHHECTSTICHRLSFMYGHLYKHARLSVPTHDRLAEQFGPANLTAFRHLAQLVRGGEAVAFDHGEAENLARYGAATPPSYLRPEHLRIPMTFVSGSENRTFLAASTELTFDWLRAANPDVAYARHVVDGYGHIDCFLGSTASEDCYPLFLEQLESCPG